jgi:hypothetical protein
VTASSASWKHLPEPLEREPLAFEGQFTPVEYEQLALGLVPEAMEDKWFIYLEDDWLRFHRSWTGAYIYGLRLERVPSGYSVVESWVNRNSDQYTETDTAYDRKLLAFLIEAFLLKKPGVVFPLPAYADQYAKGAAQHNSVGRGYPEKKS